jgi:hypothetical protein
MTRHALDGHGQQTGILRPEYGDGWAELLCDECDATWVGPIGEPCNWCATALENMRRWQAERDLTPPDIDPADERYDAVMTTWGQRLRRAVEAGRVTEQQARNAWERVNRAAA